MKKNPAVMSELQGLSNPEYAKKMKVFFKTGPGDYAEGELFMGVKTLFYALLPRGILSLIFLTFKSFSNPPSTRADC